MLVHMQIALRMKPDIHQRVTRKLLQHMIEETDAGLDVIQARSVEGHVGGYLCFFGLAVDTGFAHGVHPV